MAYVYGSPVQGARKVRFRKRGGRWRTGDGDIWPPVQGARKVRFGKRARRWRDSRGVGGSGFLIHEGRWGRWRTSVGDIWRPGAGAAICPFWKTGRRWRTGDGNIWAPVQWAREVRVGKRGVGRWRTSDGDIWTPGTGGAKGPFWKTGVDGVRAMGIYGPPAQGAREVRFGKLGWPMPRQ